MPERRLTLCGGGSPTFDAMWARYEALTPQERAALHDGTLGEKVRISALLVGDVWGGEQLNPDGTRDLVSTSDPAFNEVLRRLYVEMSEGSPPSTAEEPRG